VGKKPGGVNAGRILAMYNMPFQLGKAPIPIRQSIITFRAGKATLRLIVAASVRLTHRTWLTKKSVPD